MTSQLPSETIPQNKDCNTLPLKDRNEIKKDSVSSSISKENSTNQTLNNETTNDDQIQQVDSLSNSTSHDNQKKTLTETLKDKEIMNSIANNNPTISTSISTSTSSAPAPDLNTNVATGVAPIKKEYLKPKVTKEMDSTSKPGGTFKKRPRDEKFDPSTQLCRLIASGEGCSFSSEKCKNSHDVEGFLKRREKDLGTECPNFSTGYCKFGLNCRFASCHLDSDNKNIKLPSYDPNAGQNKNVLEIRVRNLLRKKAYPIQSQYKMRKGKKQEKVQAVDNHVNPTVLHESDESPLVKEKKKIDFQGKIYIAPLTTVGNLPFRCIMKKYGADITCGEMAMSQNLLEGQASEWALLRRHPMEDIFGVQIAGAHEDQIGRCTELLTREIDVDFIDINMGCPIDLVCNSGAGSALMARPNKLQGVIRGALTGMKYGAKDLYSMPELTVKMRTGWDHKKPNAHLLVPLVQTWGQEYGALGHSVSALTIHGRSRLMRYTKLADWDYINQCADSRSKEANVPSMSIIGGGDILSFEEWEEHLENGKLATCMLGRGPLIKPWLPTEIKERRHWDISSSERLDILKDFVHFGLQHWGSDQKGVNTTRRYLLEWLSFLCRYIPIGLMERFPQKMNERPYPYYGRNDLETLMASYSANDWVKITELLLGPVPEGFEFQPKHKANAYTTQD